MRTTKTAAAAVLVAASIAGCGGGGGQQPAPSQADGARVFASSCTGCHTLYPTRGQALPGGPLAGYRMTTSQLESFVRNMPVKRPLSDRELKAVVAFVAQAQRTRRAK
jgi:mono/diheme cytochrome c family protein